MVPQDTDTGIAPPSTMDGSTRALRLIQKIERRYGLDRGVPRPEPSPPLPLAALEQLTEEQMLINEALVARIFKCERNGEALRASEQKLYQMVAHQRQIKEAERRRLSGELHDALGQNLLALRMDVATLYHRTGLFHPHLHEWTGSALANLDQTLLSVRTLIAQLRPFEIELGLEPAIEWELNRFQRASGIDCHLEIDSATREANLSEEEVLTLYRSLQEGLGNVAKHAHASRVDVVLRTANKKVTMSILDNGVGLQSEQDGQAQGFGLLEMRERVASLGGRVTVKSLQAHGMAVTVSIPLATG